MIMFWKLGKVFSNFETRWQDKIQVDNSIDFWQFENASSKFDTCLQGNLQVEILIKSLEGGPCLVRLYGWPPSV